MALDKFPVDESALPRVEISPKKLDEWKEVAHDEIQRALSNRHSWYNAFKDKIRDGFDMIADRPNLKAFVRPVPNSNDKDLLIRSTFDNVSLDDIGYGLYAETSYDMRCVFAHMYEDNFLDGGILHTHETRTQDDPLHFVGLRWIAFRSPAPKIVTSRDFVFFSYEGTTVDVKGERVVFRFLRTMPMEDVPVDSSKLPPLVRGKISNLHIYRQNGSHVEAYVKAMHSNAGSMPSYVVTKTISFMYPGVTNMETIGDARALMRQGLTRLNPSRASAQSNASLASSSSSVSLLSQSVGPRGPTSLASANACGVCYHKFKMTRSKRQCHGCSRTVCKKCTRSLWFFDEQKQMSGTGVVKLRFCHNCTRHARTEASLSRSSLEKTPLAAKYGSTSSSSGTPRTTFPMDGSRSGSSASLSSQGSSLLARTPSHDSTGGGQYNYPRTPSYDSNGGGSYNYPRTPSHDNNTHSPSPRIPRVPSHQNVPRGVRGTSRTSHASQASQASSHHSKTSSSSHTRSQPEAEFSDEENGDDDVLDLHDGSFAIQPTSSPPAKPFASSTLMSFKSTKSSSTSSSAATTFSSSQFGGGSSTPTTKFDSSQVVNAFDGSPVVTANPLERTFMGPYSNVSIPIMPEAGDSESELGEPEDLEDFGDFHDSDSDDELVINDVGDNDGDFDLEHIGGIVNHTGLDDPSSFRDTSDSYSDAYSIIDSDDYSIAGSFSYDMGPQSFMDDFGTGSFSFDVDDNGPISTSDHVLSRGSFVPLTMLVDKPSIVAQQFASTMGPGSRPHAAAPVPQLTQRRLPPQLQPTLRNYASPPGTPPLGEPIEFDGSATMPLQGRAASRTSSTPNLLAYGMTKRTNRPGGLGMAPIRRATSGTGPGGAGAGGVIINGVNHAVLSPGASRNGSEQLATDFHARMHLHETTSSGGNSPMLRYYGS